MGRITVRVEDRLKQALEAEARAKGVRPSDVVREVLEAHLGARAPQPSALDLARDAGLIGCAKGLPADLSTNRDHLDDFGRG